MDDDPDLIRLACVLRRLWWHPDRRFEDQPIGEHWMRVAAAVRAYRQSAFDDGLYMGRNEDNAHLSRITFDQYFAFRRAQDSILYRFWRAIFGGPSML